MFNGLLFPAGASTTEAANKGGFGRANNQDFAGFRDILHERREEMFTRHLIRSLLAYSTGRLMEPADEFAVDRIHDKVKQQGLGLRSLVVECLTSDVFRSR